MRIDFEKTNDGKWFVVLPKYDGEHEDLEMVFGANTLLDKISKGNDNVSIDVMTEKPKHCNYISGLLINHDDDGGTYLMDTLDEVLEENTSLDNTFWLCNVTHFIFGEHPKQIYFKVIDNE